MPFYVVFCVVKTKTRMINKFLSSLILPCLICAALKTSAQESTNTAGGEAQGDGGSASFSIGLVDYLVSEGGDNLNCRYSSSGWYSASQGIQQSYEDERIVVSEAALNFSVFPNPVTSFFIIDAGNEDINGMSYELIDASGKLAMMGNIKDQMTQVKIQELSTGLYLLRFLQNNLEIKSHKLLLTN